MEQRGNHKADVRAEQYHRFTLWIQEDLKSDRVTVNKKVFSVVIWCLILPALIILASGFLKKYQLGISDRYIDSIVFLPSLVYALYSFWPALKSIPETFKKGGLSAMLSESVREVRWREKTVQKLNQEFKLSLYEWKNISFHLESDLSRMTDQNRYMTILTAAVLFFMYQFLELGTVSSEQVVSSPAELPKLWVDQFTSWTIQLFSLVLFSSLFYLSGFQFQRYLRRYLVCVQKLIKDYEEQGPHSSV